MWREARRTAERHEVLERHNLAAADAERLDNTEAGTPTAEDLVAHTLEYGAKESAYGQACAT